MKNTNCLNCGNEITDNFCSHCGQKTDTHRITFKNFIFHDVLHGAFHIEKGILFTATQSIIRPGKAALDYIAGKRKPYYNVFLLILIVIGLTLFVRHYYDEILVQQGRGFIKDNSDLNETSRKLDAIFAQKSKIVILLFVPFAAFNSFILFRRKKLNLSEHYIIAGMILLGIMLWSLLGNLLFYFDLLIEFTDTFANSVSFTIVSIILLYIAYGYYNAFSADYSKFEFTYRILLFFGFILLEIFLLLFLAVGIVSNWEFGPVVISPLG